MVLLGVGAARRWCCSALVLLGVGAARRSCCSALVLLGVRAARRSCCSAFVLLGVRAARRSCCSAFVLFGVPAARRSCCSAFPLLVLPWQVSLLRLHNGPQPWTAPEKRWANAASFPCCSLWQVVRAVLLASQLQLGDIRGAGAAIIRGPLCSVPSLPPGAPRRLLRVLFTSWPSFTALQQWRSLRCPSLAVCVHRI